MCAKSANDPVFVLAGASQFHGHAQVMLSKVLHLPAVQLLLLSGHHLVSTAWMLKLLSASMHESCACPTLYSTTVMCHHSCAPTNHGGVVPGMVMFITKHTAYKQAACSPHHSMHTPKPSCQVHLVTIMHCVTRDGIHRMQEPYCC